MEKVDEKFEKINVDDLKSQISDLILNTYIGCCHFSLPNNYFTPVHLAPYVEEVLGGERKATAALEKSIESLTSELYRTKMLEFCDLTTLNSRMKDKNSIFMEFYGVHDIWCRARFTVFKRDEKGFITELIYTVGTIDNEIISLRNRLQTEETLIECIKYLTVRKDFKTAINRVLTIFCEYYDADRSHIVNFDKKTQTGKIAYSIQRENVSTGLKNLKPIPLTVISRWIKILEEHGKFYVCNVMVDLEQGLEETAFLLSQGIFSLLLVPLTGINGEIEGILGVTNPRKNGDNEVLLQSASAYIEDEIIKSEYNEKLYKLSYTDGFTGLKNRQSYIEKLEEIKNSKAKNIGIIFSDINGLKKANDTFGHKAGDDLILKATDLLKKSFKGYEIFRIGGDEFVLIKTGLKKENFNLKIEAFLSDTENENTISIGEIWLENTSDIEENIKKADKKMYERKSEHYRRNHIERRNR